MTATKTAYFAGGCFWCIEAIFSRLKGVEPVISGYAGGTTENPTYEQVCTGNAGHAEVVKVSYDPRVVNYPTLLDVFFSLHDPTTPNRQGNDIGLQYRSVIFYTNPTQKTQAEAHIKKLNQEHIFSRPIVTAVQPLKKFYPAEDYHQNYFAKNPQASYCQVVVSPKIQKLKQKYRHLLK